MFGRVFLLYIDKSLFLLSIILGAMFPSIHLINFWEGDRHMCEYGNR